ncbi:MAG: ZIP family metal transporter [Pseudomonadota bacterium]|nr:ZIP family metal transporter [Pseudomonadota bacterium]
MDWNIALAGTAAGFATGFATLIGAAAILFRGWSAPSRQDLMLGFAAGVMLSASYLSLIVPASTIARENGLGSFASAAMVAAAVLAGAGSLELLRRSDRLSGAALGKWFPADDAGKRIWLLVVAMTAHNLPEGAAVGVGFAAKDPSVGLGTAIGIGVQNLPEGLAVAAALLTLGWSRKRAILASGATGLMEPLGAAIAVTLVALVSSMLPIAMGWAAGAMLYIIAAELIPAVHREGGGARATLALMVGLALMLLLDLALA